MGDGIVQWMPNSEGNDCGYCKGKDSSFSNGMWAFALSAENYQDLINRGWRRSGKYCYKPEMEKTCCPSYTIRCDALSFKLTKSHKKILKKMHKFLLNGRQENDKKAADEPIDEEEGSCQVNQVNEADICLNVMSRLEERMSCDVVEDTRVDQQQRSSETASASSVLAKNTQKSSYSSEQSSSCFEERKNTGVLPTKKKALRKQRWLEKQMLKKVPADPPTPKNREKTLEEWLDLPQGKHKLDIRLVRTTPYSSQAQRTENASHSVYQRYQMKIHGDPPSRCAMQNWNNFLVDSPIIPEEDPLLGSFHQQYWLDDRLIAVGVVDLLPLCVSSVYFYYDPEFEFLTLGTFASLVEIKLTRELHLKMQEMKWYYMGFYIHSCPKMRYKAKLPNSFLLCPEVYNWHPVEDCIAFLDVSKYSRLETDKAGQDAFLPTDFSKACMLYNKTGMTMNQLIQRKKISRKELSHIKRYCELVGSKVMEEMFYCVAK